MKSTLKSTISVLRRLHNSEQGAEGLEKLMIIGAVVIPLLGVLVFFRTQISETIQGLFSEAEADMDYNNSGN